MPGLPQRRVRRRHSLLPVGPVLPLLSGKSCVQGEGTQCHRPIIAFQNTPFLENPWCSPVQFKATALYLTMYYNAGQFAGQIILFAEANRLVWLATTDSVYSNPSRLWRGAMLCGTLPLPISNKMRPPRGLLVSCPLMLPTLASLWLS